jgi:hypothetical protein
MSTHGHEGTVRFRLFSRRRRRIRNEILRVMWAYDLNALITISISRVSIVVVQYFICLWRRKLAVLGRKS